MAPKATKEVSVENKSVITETFDKMEEISTNLAESIASDGGTGTGDTPQPGGGGGNTGGPGGTPPIGPILTMAAPIEDIGAEGTSVEETPAPIEETPAPEETDIDAVWAEILQIIKQNANYSYISTGRYLKDEVTKFTVKKFHKEFVQGGYAVSESDLRLIELCNTYFGK